MMVQAVRASWMSGVWVGGLVIRAGSAVWAGGMVVVHADRKTMQATHAVMWAGCAVVVM
ncbi:hypothetical protein [Nocardia sp. NPDC005998]|uniref:hypothetical protein n=1 Tax=Nocardia sp. NPDC005998 TaxID=3156894 RepID=UPI0033B540D7